MGKTEPTQNSENWINGKFASGPVFGVKCRKVTMHKCPYINIINVKTKPRMCDGEKWTKGKFGKLNQWKICNSAGLPSVNGNGISASTMTKKLKNGHHFINIDCTENFQITTPPKVWISGFPSVNGNGISASAIMKKLKNGCHFVNIDHTEKFQINNPPKFGSPVFQVLTEMEYQHQPLWKSF